MAAYRYPSSPLRKTCKRRSVATRQLLQFCCLLQQGALSLPCTFAMDICTAMPLPGMQAVSMRIPGTVWNPSPASSVIQQPGATAPASPWPACGQVWACGRCFPCGMANISAVMFLQHSQGTGIRQGLAVVDSAAHANLKAPLLAVSYHTLHPDVWPLHPGCQAAPRTSSRPRSSRACCTSWHPVRTLRSRGMQAVISAPSGLRPWDIPC